DINVDVTEFWTLRLAVEGAVVAHSVSGGGWVGTEYPLMVRVKYRAADGSEDMIVRGFYAQNDAGNPTDNGSPVMFNQWFQFTLDHDLMTRPVRPRQILSVEVVAGGHDYESFIRQVSLIGE
ncbi:MAG: hypothetical protein NZ518_09205, partial [Dehalococcoidia bacterium]|nr:hypothetical protein [Dehalococcoidia bacterium]